jgi:hypothetical protein
MSRITFSAAPTEEQSTRDCLDPWFFVLFKSTREVLPCCWHPAIGTLPPGGSIDEILDGPEIRELRRQLLAGELNIHCKACPARGLTDPKSLRQRLQQKMNALLKPTATASRKTG